MPHSIHTPAIAERMRWLTELGAEHSRIFASPEAYLQRRHYRAEHPTAILAFKCMDGRIHLPYITKTPLGIIQPFRNLGGAFDIGWPHLGELVTHEVLRAVRTGPPRADPRHLSLLARRPQPGLLGVRLRPRRLALLGARVPATARERLRHGPPDRLPARGRHRNGRGRADPARGPRGALSTWRTIETAGAGRRELEDQLAHALRGIFWDVPADIMRDVLPLVMGNLRHIGEVRRTERSLDIQHHEWILCVGRGFDFLHVPNTALIVGPYSPNVDEPIVKAARIIQSNMEAGRIPDDGLILLASSTTTRSASTTAGPSRSPSSSAASQPRRSRRKSPTSTSG